jgi:hypothetical protein
MIGISLKTSNAKIFAKFFFVEVLKWPKNGTLHLENVYRNIAFKKSFLHAMTSQYYQKQYWSFLYEDLQKNPLKFAWLGHKSIPRTGLQIACYLLENHRKNKVCVVNHHKIISPLVILKQIILY